MTLNEFAAKKRVQILEELKSGAAPSEGSYNEATLSQARSKNRPPQMGTTRYEPNAIHFEFIYPDPQSSPIILTVTITPPERIVYMPIPKWVIENIWQGDISGSAHFESDALALLQAFSDSLLPERNTAEFAAPAPVSRQG